jgi:hypothetical protein
MVPDTTVTGVQPREGRCSSIITQLQGFSSCSPAAVPRQWPSRRMTTSLAVGRSKPGCGFPPASASRMFIILAGAGGEPSRGPALRVGWRPASSSSIRRRRVFASLAEEADLGYAGPAGYGLSDAACPALWARRLRRRLLPLPPAALAGAWLSVHRAGDGCAVCGSGTSTPSPAPLAVLGGHTRRRTVRGWRRHSWMVLSSLRGRMGAKTSLRAPRQPPSTGAEVAAVVGAEVVAAAGEAAPCRGGCLRCRGHQSHLLLSPRLFGFNGLVVTPRRRTGRGPFHSNAHPEAIAAAGEPLGAEVIVAAGAEVVDVAGDSSMQRWSPPLVGLSRASFQRDFCWCSVVHSYRNGAGVPLVRECHNIYLLGSEM